MSFLQSRRDGKSAKRFFRRLLKSHRSEPGKRTDKLTSRLVLFVVYARLMWPPHESKTQRHVVKILDNV